jgi:uncharacterized protein YndB with AHSA1/START domain
MTDSENGIVITRIFNAPKEKVWTAWTDSEMVKKWWGPAGFTAPSIRIDLTVGGKYIYCMHGPPGTPFDSDMYSAGVFKEIVPGEKLVISDYFSDKDGNKVDPTTMGMAPDMPAEMDVVVLFETVEGNKTKLSIVYPKPASQAAFEAMLKSGMEEGWSTSLDKLGNTVEEKG